jgi:hypothetical protein
MKCKCGESVPPARSALGYTTCLQCGEQHARQRKHTVIPLHKQGYAAYSGEDALAVIRQLNPKRSTGY